jgi:hypothetical protein
MTNLPDQNINGLTSPCFNETRLPGPPGNALKKRDGPSNAYPAKPSDASSCSVTPNLAPIFHDGYALPQRTAD